MRARWSALTVALAATSIGCVVAGSAVAATRAGGPSATTVAHRYCTAFGPPDQTFFYRQDASNLADMTSNARTMIRSPQWHALGEDLLSLVRLGPSASWAPSQDSQLNNIANRMYQACAEGPQH